jgi:hypothetical protein
LTVAAGAEVGVIRLKALPDIGAKRQVGTRVIIGQAHVLELIQGLA